MTRARLLAAAVVLAALGAAGFVLAGFPADAPEQSGPTDGATPTVTPPDTVTASPGSPSPATTAPEATATPTVTPASAFGFSVEEVSDCGDTCRDVRATVTNQRSAPATNVTVAIDLFAGNGTDGELVWEGTVDVGRLDPGANRTITRRVRLSPSDALAVQQRGGTLTVVATVRSTEASATFVHTRDAE